MEIARERFMDDTPRYHVTLTLRSRTTEMHSVLSALAADDRDAVSVILAQALDEVQRLLAQRGTVTPAQRVR